jgi:hypothetical protein
MFWGALEHETTCSDIDKIAGPLYPFTEFLYAEVLRSTTKVSTSPFNTYKQPLLAYIGVH